MRRPLAILSAAALALVGAGCFHLQPEPQPQPVLDIAASVDGTECLTSTCYYDITVVVTNQGPGNTAGPLEVRFTDEYLSYYLDPGTCTVVLEPGDTCSLSVPNVRGDLTSPLVLEVTVRDAGIETTESFALL